MKPISLVSRALKRVRTSMSASYNQNRHESARLEKWGAGGVRRLTLGRQSHLTRAETLRVALVIAHSVICALSLVIPSGVVRSEKA
jgi:hypothetical protein